MKKTFIEKIKAGDRVDDIFVLSEKTMAQKRDGNSFLNVALSDKTGTLKGVVWDNVPQVAATVKAGDFVRVRGSVSEYRGLRQFVVKEMAPAGGDGVDPGDFFAGPRRIRSKKCFKRLTDLTDAMADGHLKALFNLFWQDADFVKGFKRAPAAKKNAPCLCRRAVGAQPCPWHFWWAGSRGITAGWTRTCSFPGRFCMISARSGVRIRQPDRLFR